MYVLERVCVVDETHCSTFAYNMSWSWIFMKSESVYCNEEYRPTERNVTLYIDQIVRNVITRIIHWLPSQNAQNAQKCVKLTGVLPARPDTKKASTIWK
jgi:hypothetical protein